MGKLPEGIKIVVVDDDESCNKTLSKLLELEGIKIIGNGYNGEEAFQLYKQHNPDILITDLKMPEFDGQYGIEKIKNEFPDAKIIAVSGYARDYDIVSKTDGVLNKPYDIHDLLGLIEKISGQKVIQVRKDSA